ncbi:RagB/SusD family nutrient uptake outer membrane protein [Prolixibacteraceae bacterium Z1-6]|uniref:RagB/SusD family nutrient uptake outer membrane protein n=1 Tax=Draconibacterium aestuarii TaxID=2998507 RepID=A0A9X3FBF3_9BACT|nr:RagB/SusD family nutrient uptake outer membrane protein [Prolixibacteraceae bacterium Z1-6]
MKNIKKYLFIFVLAVGFSACTEGWLELSNPNLQTTETFWQTDADFAKGVTAAYQSLAVYDGTFLRFAPFALDARADDVWSPSPWDVLSNTGSFKLANNSIMQNWLWIGFFGVNHRANQVLDYIDDVEFEDATKKDQYKGEALFLRGLANFYLVTFFENIPLVTTSIYVDNDKDYFPTQAAPEEVWAQIISDWTEAANLLPATYDASETGRATKGAALAYLGKAYLTNHDYTNAAVQFEKVKGMGYDLVANYADNFNEAGENNSESVFEIQFSREVGGTVLGWVGAPAADWSLTTARAITYTMSPFGWGDAACTQWIFDEFKAEKTIENEDDPRLRTSIFYAGDVLYGQEFDTVFFATPNALGVKKYSNFDSGRADEKDWRSGINERLMRYSDVLLMLAECEIQEGNIPAAAQLMTTVRDRANLPDRTAEFAAMSKDAIMEQLAHERALEFCFEGHRFDDIQRWGWLDNPTKLAELQQHDSEFLGYVPGREFFSIPQAQIEVNGNFKQNDGY